MSSSENFLSEIGRKHVGGWKHTDEWKLKQSNRMKGMLGKFGKDNPRFGISLTAEIKRKIGEGRKGKLHSTEAKLKMATAKTGKYNILSKKITIKHKDELKEFDTFSSASSYLGLPKNSFSKWLKSGTIPKKHCVEIISY